MNPQFPKCLGLQLSGELFQNGDFKVFKIENLQECYRQVIFVHLPTPNFIILVTATPGHQVWLNRDFYSKLGNFSGAP